MMLSRTDAPGNRRRTISSQHDGSGCPSCIRYDWDDECGFKIGEAQQRLARTMSSSSTQPQLRVDRLGRCRNSAFSHFRPIAYD
jgi:hypothetical protein